MILLLLLFIPFVLSVTPVTIAGNKFFKDDTQFFIKGIAYQQIKGVADTLETPYVDPMANPTTCLRDLAHLVDLGVNLVRVYQIDPAANHDLCMTAFGEAGIYVLLDLAEPEMSINRNDPSWDTELLDRYIHVVDSMAKYANVFGFIAGNEVTNSKSNTDASPFVKAAIRDVKSHIKKKKYRKIPVGYTGNDDAEIRKPLADYFACEIESNTLESAADFVGLNNYEWCGYSTYPTSGYRDRTVEFSGFPVPIFFSEYGCNKVVPRPFTEVEALYGSTMSQVWSGGIAYKYFNGSNGYGLVSVVGLEVVRNEEFAVLRQRLMVDPHGAKNPQSAPQVPPKSKCPAQSEIWNASTTLPPTPDSGKCECLQTTLTCVITPYRRVDLALLLREICAQIDCRELEVDGSAGTYGRYSDCSIGQRASYAANKYFVQNGAGSCDFGGRAVELSPASAPQLNQLSAQDGRTCSEALGPLEMTEPDLSAKHRHQFNATYKSLTKSKSSKKSMAARITASLHLTIAMANIFMLVQ